MSRSSYLPDNFTLARFATVGLASLLPAAGQVAVTMNTVTTLAIALLFFLHGAKLSREAIITGAKHWRLHLLVFASTFVLFPLLGLLLKPVAQPLLTQDLYLGILFLCMLPSTVQSSIALVGMAKGNVPAAVCSASASNFIGIFLTPVLVNLFVIHGSTAQSATDSMLAIVMQLLLPFVVGQFARRWIGKWVDRNKAWLKYIDQGSILLVVYVAFSEAVNQDLWHQLSASALAWLLIVNGVLLALVLAISTLVSRRFGFKREDEITIVFCGSKKSLASGVPMLKVLFVGHPIGMTVLPLMLFHQIQLMVCAVLAQRYSRRSLL